MRLLSEILLVAMAVFGLYCLFRLWAAACFSSGRVGAVVLLPDEAARRELEELLREADRAPFRPRRVPVTVLYARTMLREGEEFSPQEQALLQKYGAKCYPFGPPFGESGLIRDRDEKSTAGDRVSSGGEERPLL